MKTAIQIAQEHNFTCSAHMMRELHNNGHFDRVLDYLKKNHGTTTAYILHKELCTAEKREFNDSQGVYAGTYHVISYMGNRVMEYTNWSLFN